MPSKRRPKLVPKMTIFNTKLTNVSIAYDVFHIRAGLVLVDLSIAMADAASLLAKLRDAHKKRALTEAKTLLAQIKVCAYSLCLFGLVPPCLCVTLGGCSVF